MSRFCRTCDALKPECVKCHIKDLYYCEKHTTNLKKFRGDIYCKKCLDKDICPCGEEVVAICTFDEFHKDKHCVGCSKWHTISVGKVCDNCYMFHVCKDCNEHRRTTICYICKGKYCNGCRSVQIIDVSPMTLNPGRLTWATYRCVHACNQCMATRTIVDVQDMYRNLG
jgi:hypothetical protein